MDLAPSQWGPIACGMMHQETWSHQERLKIGKMDNVKCWQNTCDRALTALVDGQMCNLFRKLVGHPALSVISGSPHMCPTEA